MDKNSSTISIIIFVILAIAAMFWGIAIRKYTAPETLPAIPVNPPPIYQQNPTSTPSTPVSNPPPVVVPPPEPVIANDDYSDIAVIINNNSPISQQIGEYFAGMRNIPPQNLIEINTTTTEEISDTEFQILRSQIENYITLNNLKDKINYIVTTKGIPLKVKRGEFNSDGQNASALDSEHRSASVDSELTLIFSRWSVFIGSPNQVVGHSYYLKNERFSRAKHEIYLVTRLDGYTVDQVIALIDRAGHPEPFTSSTKFVFDGDPTWNLNNLNGVMANAAKALQERGFNVILDTSEAFLTNQQNVIGYASWGSNDRHATSSTENAKPKNTWHNGAIAETYVSTSGRTFNQPAVYGQSLIADLIAEGITGAKGYVYEPYGSAMADVSVLFDRYTKGYNLAESFYAASPFLSWMDIVIGDPKATIVIPK